MLGGNEENDPSRNNRAQVYSKSQNNKKTQSFAWMKQKEWVVRVGERRSQTESTGKKRATDCE